MKVKVSGLVWIPGLRKHQYDNICRELTIHPKRTTNISKKNPEPIHLFSEGDDGSIGVPRYYYLERKTGNHEEILDVSYGYPMRKLTTRYKAEGPYVEQNVAIESLMGEFDGKKWGGALLRADPGFGKTLCAIEVARRLGRRTLVLVHKDVLLEQWIERIHDMMPDANVGIIKQERCEHDFDARGDEPDFVVGLLQSLSRDKYSEKMYSSFGLVIADEVHRVAAASWSRVLPRFRAAYRLGASATPRRKDGAQDVFFKHISPITYSASTKLMKPELRRIFTGSELEPISRGEYKISVRNLNSAQVLSQLCSDNFRSRDIVDDLVGAVVAGRKSLVISERLAHIRYMAGELSSGLFDLELPFIPKIDFMTGQWFTGEEWTECKRNKKGKILHRKGDPKLRERTKDELKKAESANVIFATKMLLEEGFDLPPIDVLVLSSPMSDIEQVIGRIQRFCLPNESKCKRWCPWRAGTCKGKPVPIVVDVVDENEKRLMSKYNDRMRFYKKIGMIGGG